MESDAKDEKINGGCRKRDNTYFMLTLCPKDIIYIRTDTRNLYYLLFNWINISKS